jgi:Flp pilus assembly protein TadD
VLCSIHCALRWGFHLFKGEPMPSDMKSEQAWLEQARSLILRGDTTGAESVVVRALKELPQSFELRRILAGICRQTHRAPMAEMLLADLHAERPGDAATAFELARMLIARYRSSAAAAVMHTCFEHGHHDAELAIQAIELLDDCGHQREAVRIAERAIAASPDDARLHAYAGMLEIQSGEFDSARAHYLYALEHTPQACEWHLPHGLALMQRYRDAAHPDFARFRQYLERDDLGAKARSTLLFALAKAYDDIGEFEQAAAYSRRANALAHTLTGWSRKHWRRAIQARQGATPISTELEPQPGFVPVFIVGVPRSGTTLVSELLARHPRVCNRGESPWVASQAQQAGLIDNPGRLALQRAAATYAALQRQDDAEGKRWFLDKQPLNFRYIDLIVALFPDAKIIYCRRNARDNALSLWMQSFLEEVQGYAYDFGDIALVIRDSEQLMAHWKGMYADSIHEVRYEQLVASPETVVGRLGAWLGLPASETETFDLPAASTISTASVWQARQPVYTRSAGRWKFYASYLPELLKFDTDDSGRGAVQRPS